MGMMKVPALVFIFICFASEISLNILRSITDQVDFYYPIIGLYSIIQIMVAIFNTIAGYRFLRSLKQTECRKRVKMIIWRIILSGIIYIISFFIMVSARQFDSPLTLVLFWLSLQILWFLQSILLITIFTVPKKKTETEETSKEHSTQKENSTQ